MEGLRNSRCSLVTAWEIVRCFRYLTAASIVLDVEPRGGSHAAPLRHAVMASYNYESRLTEPRGGVHAARSRRAVTASYNYGSSTNIKEKNGSKNIGASNRERKVMLWT